MPATQLTSDIIKNQTILTIPSKYVNQVSSALASSNGIASSTSVRIPNPDIKLRTDICESEIDELKLLWNKSRVKEYDI